MEHDSKTRKTHKRFQKGQSAVNLMSTHYELVSEPWQRSF